MSNFASRAQTVAAVVQSTAIILAGVWATYEFILKEQAKSLHVVPTLEVEIAGQPLQPATGAPGVDSRRLLPVEVNVVVDNSSDKEAYILAGYVTVWAHKSGKEHVDITEQELASDAGRTLLDMKYVTWTDDFTLIGHAASFANKLFAPREHNSQKVVFFVPAKSYDLLEVQASFYVVDACTGFYPFETCYSFLSVFSWDTKEFCENPDEFQGNDYCVHFYKRLDDDGDWLPVPDEELENRFDIGNFTTTEMIVLPGAPILESATPPSEGAVN
jgi:hypothetical protein